MLQVKDLNYPSNAFGRFWMKVPLVLRSILIGFGVSSLGVSIWTIIVIGRLPGPWSVLLMGTFLIFFWMYFSGKWKPSNTQAFRRFCTRKIKLKRLVWIWGLIAAFIIFIIVNASFMLTFRFVEFQPEIFKIFRDVNDYPAWMSWSLTTGDSTSPTRDSAMTFSKSWRTVMGSVQRS